jgi:acetylglutamate kinase
MDNLQKAQILSEALPYIQEYSGQIVVVKYGGAAMQSEELKEAVINDILLLHLVGIHVVLVHGGGPEINELLGKLGKEPKFVNGLRYTDEETMEVVQMVLCGKVCKDLVSRIQRGGGRALGLSGLDGGMFSAVRSEQDIGLVGEIKAVDPQPVVDALQAGYLPVVSTVAQGEDADVSYNINADTAASRLAIALKAKKLILLTDVRGILRDSSDESTLLPVIPLHEIPGLVKDGVITGGMTPKVDCCVHAIRQGVSRATILDGRVPHALLVEMLTESGVGTMLV